MGWPDDGLAAAFLVCFFTGLLFSVASFVFGLGGNAEASGHGHSDLLHGMGHGGLDANGQGTTSVATHGSTLSHDVVVTDHAAHHGAHAAPSPLNLSTIMAFLTWFGGAGYILRTYYLAWGLIAIGGAVTAGIAGAWLVYLFMARILFASQRVLDPRDFHLPGTLARVTSPIRAHGTGEIVYTKQQIRHVAGARAVDGQPIRQGTEVVIMRYESGIAYVQPWEEVLADSDRSVGGPEPRQS